MADGLVFNWFGGRILEENLAATQVVVTNVTRAAANHARSNHPSFPPAAAPGERFANRTDDLIGKIWSAEATIEGLDVKGWWGAHSPGLFVEMGTVKMGARPFLQPAAAATYHMANFAGSIIASRLGHLGR